MKVTFDSKIGIETFPYVATYEDVYVLVTGPGRNSETRSGIMINSNTLYSPFTYKCDLWVSDTLKPYCGKITIECP